MPRHSEQEIAEAVELYKAGASIIEVARLVRTSEKNVSAWMRAAKVTRHGGTTKNTKHAAEVRVQALMDLNNSGDPAGVVAKRHGVPRTTLLTWQRLEDGVAFTGEWVQDGYIMRPVRRVA